MLRDGINGQSPINCLQLHRGEEREIKELNINIKEADIRVVPHTLSMVTSDIKRLVVLSADTDDVSLEDVLRA